MPPVAVTEILSLFLAIRNRSGYSQGRSGKVIMAGKASKSNRFPLSKHSTGQWRKKIHGHIYYFGTDRDAALARYVAERADLETCKPAEKFRRAGDTVTLADLCNAYLTARRRHVESGELLPSTWSQYRGECKRLVAILGRETSVSSLTTDDFARLRTRAAEELGPRALGSFVVIVRSIFKWGWESEHLATSVRFGPDFKRPGRRVVRLEGTGTRKTLTADECRRLIEAADTQLRAMVLLGLNCGYGPSDCSRLDQADLDREPGWLAGPRFKTAVPRRCPLWPETADATRAAAAARPRPKHKSDADAVFLTRMGNRWVRHLDRGSTGKAVSRRDSIGTAFSRLCGRSGVEVWGRFYCLRRTFRTVADGARDQVAAGILMGHVDSSMGGVYREKIEDDRLRAVAEHVRVWLSS
jgi:integrase